MALSRKEVLKRMGPNVEWNRRLVVEPFFKDSLDENSVSASLDFHLGNRFSVLRSGRAVLHDPLGHDDVVAKEIFIPMGREFTLPPGQLVLGTTLEWFRFPADLTAYVIGRSIWGRRGLLIVTAQAVQPCSSGTITLEMRFLGQMGLRLRPGVSIGQLFFHRLGEEDSDDATFTARQSTFTGASSPVLGTYLTSEVEEMLLEL